MSRPNICVLKADGINCDGEMVNAFENAGGEPDIVHVNQLHEGDRSLGQYNVLAIPGGFSYGDDVASGKILATELISRLNDQLSEFVDNGRPVIGICNGFQVLVRAGLLPNRTIGEQHLTLAQNTSGRFECRWIELAVGNSACKFIRPEDFDQQSIPMQVAHGEGRLFSTEDKIQSLADNGQVVFRYASPDNKPPTGYPDNPNGSMDDIAGICDPSGLVLGMMPHPERSISSFHPNRVRTDFARTAGRLIFANIIDYVREM